MNRRDFLALGRAPLRHTGTAPEKVRPGTPSAPIAQSITPAYQELVPYVPLASDPWTFEKAAHLLRRCVIGPTVAEIRRAVAEGPDVTMGRLLEPFEPSLYLIDDWVGEDPSNWPPSFEGPENEKWSARRLDRRERLGRWWLKTIAESPLSIQERMAIFWHSHFTSEMRAVENAEWMYPQIQLFRTMGLGNFRELVRGVSKGMAMIKYLDGHENYVDGPRKHINENFARELMELYTIGVVDWDGNTNYTQRDVMEGARALTGWSYEPSPAGERHLKIESRFFPERWDPGKKSFLGRSGYLNLDDVIDIIFSQRPVQISRFICEKLYRVFVYDVPDRAVVAAMAETLLRENWELKPVLVELLRSVHFYRPTHIGALPKSSVDFYVGLIRSLGLKNVMDFKPNAPWEPNNELTNRLLKLGHMLLHPPNVKGWAGGRAWVNTASFPPRQKFAMDVGGEHIAYWDGKGMNPMYTYNPLDLARSFVNPNDIHQLCADMAEYFLPTRPTPREMEKLFNTLLDGGVDYEWDIDDPDQQPSRRIRRLLRAIFQMSKYQLY